MKILLTGGNGLVGKNILENSKAKKYEFFAPSSKELNLLNKASIESFLLSVKPDMVIHCAGKVGGIQANLADMPGFLVENMEMGFNLISACRDQKISKVLNLGSSCIYPKKIGEDIKEDDLLSGELEPTNEGYAIAKIAVLKLCEYISSKNELLSYKTLIPCNIYGRHDHFDAVNSHMVPAVMMRMHEATKAGKKTILIWGDGTARREFMFAEDLADAIYFSIENFEKLPIRVNVGLGYDYSVLEYYKAIAGVVGFKGEFEFDLTKPKGMQRKLINVDELKKIGWSSKVDLRTGLEKTYNYYLSKVRG